MSSSAAQEAQDRERSALRLSIVVSCVFAVIALVWGLIEGSQVILLDAIFTPLGLLSTWGALLVARLAAKGPTRTFPFGRDALIPLFVIAQALVMLAGLAYAVFEAVRVILDGGSDVGGVTLLAYGLFSAVVCTVTSLVLRRMARQRPLIDAEAAGWLSAAASSLVIVVGGVLVLIIAATPLAWLTPFADSALVIASSVALAAIPVGLARRSVRELQIPVPDEDMRARIDAVVAEVCTAEGLPHPIVRVGRVGPSLVLELAFVLPEGSGDVACEDRVRRQVTAGLRDLPLELWLLVEFTYDAGLVE